MTSINTKSESTELKVGHNVTVGDVSIGESLTTGDLALMDSTSTGNLIIKGQPYLEYIQPLTQVYTGLVFTYTNSVGDPNPAATTMKYTIVGKTVFCNIEIYQNGPLAWYASESNLIQLTNFPFNFATGRTTVEVKTSAGTPTPWAGGTIGTQNRDYVFMVQTHPNNNYMNFVSHSDTLLSRPVHTNMINTNASLFTLYISMVAIIE